LVPGNEVLPATHQLLFHPPGMYLAPIAKFFPLFGCVPFQAEFSYAADFPPLGLVFLFIFLQYLPPPSADPPPPPILDPFQFSVEIFWGAFSYHHLSIFSPSAFSRQSFPASFAPSPSSTAHIDALPNQRLPTPPPKHPPPPPPAVATCVEAPATGLFPRFNSFLFLTCHSGMFPLSYREPGSLRYPRCPNLFFSLALRPTAFSFISLACTLLPHRKRVEQTRKTLPPKTPLFFFFFLQFIAVSVRRCFEPFFPPWLYFFRSRTML